MAQKSKPLSRQPRSRSKAAKTEVQADPLTHPEEMRASGEIHFGNLALKGTVRVTPAGVICAGMAGVAVLTAATVLVHFARRRT